MGMKVESFLERFHGGPRYSVVIGFKPAAINWLVEYKAHHSRLSIHPGCRTVQFLPADRLLTGMSSTTMGLLPSPQPDYTGAGKRPVPEPTRRRHVGNLNAADKKIANRAHDVTSSDVVKY